MGAFPPEPANLDWSTVNLANLPETNGHVEVHYSTSAHTWGKPQLVQDPYMRVHGLAPGLNYGQQCYEGLKAFRTNNKAHAIHVFRPQAHAARLRNSAAMVLLPEVPDELFLECVRMVVVANAEFVPPADNDTGFLYLRPVLFGAGPQLLLQPPEHVIFAVHVTPMCSPVHGTSAVDALVLDEFDRAAPRGVGAGKLGGNYAPVWPFSVKAAEAGFAITLHLDSETRSLVEEFSTSGFVGVVTAGGKRELYVPETDNAVRSVTSDSLLAVAKGQGWKVYREKVPFAGLNRFSQVFAVGTGATAVPVCSVTRPATGEKYNFSSEGPGTALVKRLLDVQRGSQSAEPDWCWTVRDTRNITNEEL
ncbi:Branched-chain amino acid aminotransferase II [Metarhizium guizhouense ARSEF 977]|uniref:Branched-chain amino acid aminotransferase II n=1 Tax=Metarhizium guizhouense (strain ARSEF 977) TaxID=1276136 RepID=A0A0B4GU90_METGA|nr:Branched-chain amino acid aminotransferase II [Metarhizium guizhouense ARSEF 977]